MFKKIMVVVMLGCFCSGCATLFTTGLIEYGGREYSHAKNIAKNTSHSAIAKSYYTYLKQESIIAGTFLGIDIIDSEIYYHYGFRRFFDGDDNMPWRAIGYIEIFLNSEKEPILKFHYGAFITDRKDFDSFLNRADTILYTHTIREIDLSKVQSEVQTDLRYRKMKNPSILCLYLTKDMIDSEIVVGELQNGTCVWSPPFVVTKKSMKENTRKTRELLRTARKHWSPIRRVFYVFLPIAVAVDVVLIPIYLYGILTFGQGW